MQSKVRRTRPPTRVDVAARLVASALPRRLTPAIDRLRLDIQSVGQAVRGEARSSLLRGESPELPPPALDAIAPLDHLLPRAWALRAKQTHRDLGMIAASLWGEKPAPIIARSRSAPASSGAAVGLVTRELRIENVVRETADAISIYVARPDGRPIEFTAGQFFTLEIELDGQRLRRAYSLAGAALPGHAPHITVKRIPGGRVSEHLHRTANVGDRLAVFGPSGSFTFTPDAARARRLVCFAGGSGITPIASIVATLLATEPASRVDLVYGNRRWQDVIFGARLEALAASAPTRSRIDHVLEHPPEEWSGARGLLTREVVEERLDALAISDDEAVEYFVCGPTPMMEAVEAALRARGVPESRIHRELFVRPEERKGAPRPTTPQRITFLHGGHERQVVASPDQTLLEAGLAAGIAMPFSCAMGGCAACRVRLVAGEIEAEEPNCLSASEKADGYVLTCVSRARSAVTIEVP